MSNSPPADPNQLRDGARRFQGAASHLQTTHDTLTKATTQLAQGGAWLGSGSQSFADAWRRFGADTHGAVGALQTTATILNKFADAIEQQQQSQAWSIVAGIGLGLLTVVEVGVDAAQGGVDVATDAATVVTADAAASAFAAVGDGFAAAEDAAITGLDAVADSAVDVGDIADVGDVSADIPDDPFTSDPTTSDPTMDSGAGNQPLNQTGSTDDMPFNKAMDDASQATADTYGPAWQNNPEEYQQIMDDLQNSGVRVNLNDDIPLGQGAYGPSSTPGEPGSLTVNPDTDISTLAHEYEHFVMDRELGFPGLRYYMENPEELVAGETQAYTTEIDRALAQGNQQLADLLKQALEDCINGIKDRYGL